MRDFLSDYNSVEGNSESNSNDGHFNSTRTRPFQFQLWDWNLQENPILERNWPQLWILKAIAAGCTFLMKYLSDRWRRSLISNVCRHVIASRQQKHNRVRGIPANVCRNCRPLHGVPCDTAGWTAGVWGKSCFAGCVEVTLTMRACTFSCTEKINTKILLMFRLQ